MSSSPPGFSRRFGEVLHYQWAHGNGAVDLVEALQVGLAAGNAITESAGLGTGGFRLLRPLTTEQGSDSIVWLERYADYHAWATTEIAAQRSPEWMGMILAGQQNLELSWLGESHAMVEDTLGEDVPPQHKRVAIDWTTYDTTKLAALTTFPELTQELAEAARKAGFTESGVRYFGMPTSAGRDLNLAHVWIEHPSPSVLGEFLGWRQASPELADWRQRLRQAGGEPRSHHLLSQVA